MMKLTSNMLMVWRYRIGDRDYRRRLTRWVQEILALLRRFDAVRNLPALSNAVNLGREKKARGWENLRLGGNGEREGWWHVRYVWRLFWLFCTKMFPRIFLLTASCNCRPINKWAHTTMFYRRRYLCFERDSHTDYSQLKCCSALLISPNIFWTSELREDILIKVS